MDRTKCPNCGNRYWSETLMGWYFDRPNPNKRMCGCGATWAADEEFASRWDDFLLVVKREADENGKFTENTEPERTPGDGEVGS